MAKDPAEAAAPTPQPKVPGIEFTCEHGEAKKGETRRIVPNDAVLQPGEMTAYVGAKLVTAGVAKALEVPAA